MAIAGCAQYIAVGVGPSLSYFLCHLVDAYRKHLGHLRAFYMSPTYYAPCYTYDRYLLSQRVLKLLLAAPMTLLSKLSKLPDIVLDKTMNSIVPMGFIVTEVAPIVTSGANGIQQIKFLENLRAAESCFESAAFLTNHNHCMTIGDFNSSAIAATAIIVIVNCILGMLLC